MNDRQTGVGPAARDDRERTEPEEDEIAERLVDPASKTQPAEGGVDEVEEDLEADGPADPAG